MGSFRCDWGDHTGNKINKLVLFPMKSETAFSDQNVKLLKEDRKQPFCNILRCDSDDPISYKINIPLIKFEEINKAKKETIHAIVRFEILCGGAEDDIVVGLANDIKTDLKGTNKPGIDSRSLGYFCNIGQFRLNWSKTMRMELPKASTNSIIEYWISTHGKIYFFINQILIGSISGFLKQGGVFCWIYLNSPDTEISVELNPHVEALCLNTYQNLPLPIEEMNENPIFTFGFLSSILATSQDLLRVMTRTLRLEAMLDPLPLPTIFDKKTNVNFCDVTEILDSEARLRTERDEEGRVSTMVNENNPMDLSNLSRSKITSNITPAPPLQQQKRKQKVATQFCRCFKKL